LAALAAAALIAAGIIVWRSRVRERRVMERLAGMLDAAMDAGFTETSFDESLFSALEAKLARWLKASALSRQNLAAEKERIKTLISDISHQTKAPVANLLLYAGLLAEAGKAPEESRSRHGSRSHAALIVSQAEKLRFLTDALVKASRLETGIVSVVPAANSVDALLEEVITQLKSAAQARDISISFLRSNTIAVFDPKWTAEALSNIIDNAIKYTPPGGRVSLRAGAFELFCRIDIEDTGPGIAEDEQARVFGRFYRSPRVQQSEGVGLGLYLAREMVSVQGGYISLRSAPGEGSCFSVFLPAAGGSRRGVSLRPPTR
jgi:signal transduction histidine kinase